MGYIVGVDVSSYQGKTYSCAGLAFSIVKATEGTGYDNPKYLDQVECARKGGLVVGHYHYLDGTDVAAEFAHFAAVARVESGDIIALDWEAAPATAAARDAWLHAAKAHYPHNRVVLYCDVDYWDGKDPTHYAADGLWIADYKGGSEPDISQPWLFWQYSSADGIDHSYGVFTHLAALVAWAVGLEPAPAPSTDEDDFMSVTAVAGRAGLAWPTGKCHALGVNYDKAQPDLRVVMCLNTGPFVVAESWKPEHGCDALHLPAEHVPHCQGVILTAADGAVFDLTAS